MDAGGGPGLLMRSPHEWLPKESGYSDGAVVSRPYDFYHFRVDGFCDDGWGCAYRSLQTIYSWYLLNSDPASLRARGAKQLTVPSHRDIQQVLVEIGDKGAEHVGSRDWIGSFELALVLDVLLEVPCKVMHLAGLEAVAKAHDVFVQHFATIGSPVMIGHGDGGAGGGGARVLLGVRRAGEKVQCLMADPHYTGTMCGARAHEAIARQEAAAPVRWSALDEYFMEGQFYNMLLPQTVPR